MRIHALVLLLAAFAVPGELLAQVRTSSGHEAAKGTGQTSVEANSTIGSRTICTNGRAGAFPCRNVDLLAHMTIGDIGGDPGTRLNDIWGWTDPDTGREYALVGRSDGTAFIDVTNPQNPVYLGSLPAVGGAESAWRDMKTIGNYALVVMDFPTEGVRHGIQIFDLTLLRGISNPPTEFEETAHYSGFVRAHNIVANEATEYAYAVGSETCAGGLHMVDFRDPLNPTFAGCYANSGYTHDAQCVVYNGPDAEYQGREICIGSNANHVVIADVTDKSNVQPISGTTYPDIRYAHQAWLTPDQRYLLLDDELDSSLPGTRTLIFDVVELDDPQLIAEYFGTSSSTDHNQYVRRDRDFQANYTSGLRVLDVSEITQPKEVGFFDTYPADDNPGFRGAWSNYPYFASGIVIVSSINEGLFILDPTGPAVTGAQETDLPRDFALLAAFPNPFRSTTTVRLQVDQPQQVRVTAYDVQGREVVVLHDAFVEAGGTREMTFDAAELANGIYVIRAEGGFTRGSVTVTVQK